MLRGERVGHGPPTVEREAWELRVLGAVILQALVDMQSGDGEAEAWLAEAIGLDGDEMRGLARQFVRRRGRRSFDSGLRPSAQDDRGRDMKGERVCRHCGESYRGLACPCRKRAAAAARAKVDEGRGTKDEGVQASVGSMDEAIGGSLADGKG